MTRDRVHLSDAEWRIMNALWQGSPASVRDVLDRIEGSPRWAYTTVKTLLARLVEKGAVSVERQRGASLFTPCISQNEARRRALRSLIDRAFGGSLPPLVQFLLSSEPLSARERAELSAWVGCEKNGKAGGEQHGKAGSNGRAE